MTKLWIRVDLDGGARIGPGKVRLLEEIARSGSISAAGRALKMSYRRAWELVEDLNHATGAVLVATATGGVRGGGATLTEAGHELVATYRALEQAAAEASRPVLERLARLAPAAAPAGAP